MRYDGALGVISGLVALRTLHERFGAPQRSLECVSFCEEEGSRFPGAAFWGSRAVTGGIQPGEAEQLQGYDGVTMAAAMGASAACGGCSCSDGTALAAADCSSGAYLARSTHVGRTFDARSTRVAISDSNPSRIARGSDASLQSVAMLIQRLPV